jgi:mannose-6-phosphate isomerase-like protein (cupin superfamily)
MSYPPPRYNGDGGLVNAVHRPAGAEPEVRYKNGGTAHYLATGASTSGQFGLYRWEMSGARSGPDPHFHRTFAESFYVLSGTVRIFDGRDWADRQPGDFVFIPEGGIHGFRNESSEPASMLILFTPGAPREDYFETLARMSEGLVLSDEEKAEFYLRHDNYYVEPGGWQ